MDLATAYAVLGLKVGASGADIRQAYLDLAKVWHPDRFPDDARLRAKASAELARINEAYAVIRGKWRADVPQRPSAASRPAEPKSPPQPTPDPDAVDPRKREWVIGLLLLAGFGFLLALGTAIQRTANEPSGSRPDPSLAASTPQTAPAVEAPKAVPAPSQTSSDLNAEIDRTLADLEANAGRKRPSPPSRASRNGSGSPALMPGDSSSEAATPLPKENRRLPNGTEILTDSALSGRGQFKIHNGRADDAVVALLVEGRRIRATYIRAKSQVVLEGIAPGVYTMAFMTGRDWDDDQGEFTRPVGQFEFEKQFSFEETRKEGGVEYTVRSVTLQSVPGGNVRIRPPSRPLRFPKVLEGRE